MISKLLLVNSILTGCPTILVLGQNKAKQVNNYFSPP